MMAEYGNCRDLKEWSEYNVRAVGMFLVGWSLRSFFMIKLMMSAKSFLETLSDVVIQLRVGN
jgi:hypothetical protein